MSSKKRGRILIGLGLSVLGLSGVFGALDSVTNRLLSTAFAQSVTGEQSTFVDAGTANPVPLINQPLAPDAAPDGTGFGLTVKGAGFVSGSGSAGSSPTYVFDAASFGTGNNPSSVAAGDLDGHGRLDLVVANEGGMVSILLSNRNGSFRAPVDYATGANPRCVVVGDFNGDGKLDIATANTDDNTVSILLGNGDGTFVPHVDYATGSSPRAVVAGDFNGDGKLDLAAANYSSGTVSILLGNGDGTFQPHVDYSTTSFGSPSSVTTGDFNGDGKLDLAVTNDVSDTLSILPGNGDGTLQPHVDYYTFFGPSAVIAGDFNGDGKLDLAVADYAPFLSNFVSVFAGNGDGTFKTRVDYAVGGPPTTLTAGDFNGDGKLDLAAGTLPSGSGGGNVPVSGTLSVLLNNGDGTFQSHRDFGGVSPLAVIAADFNGDSHLDIAMVNGNLGTINIVLGDGRGNFGSVLDTLTPGGATQALSGDFNNDGKGDLVYCSPGSGSVSVSLGNGDGTFGAPLTNSAPGGGCVLATGDFNLDGNLDVALVVGSEASPSILLGNGDGTFQPRTSYPVSNIPDNLLVADFNGDGNLDLVVLGFGIDTLLGNGDGTFQAPIEFASNGSYSAAAVGDFNNDGKLDFVAVDGPNGASVFLGNGDGTFRRGVQYHTGPPNSGADAIAVADLNGDGILDLAVANDADNTVSVLLGNADGTFQSFAQFLVVSGPVYVAAGDIDGDGKADLVASGNGVSVLLGNGDGTFKRHVDYAISTSSSVITGDFNGDGRLDLAVANGPSSTISVLLNATAFAIAPSNLHFPPQLVGTSSATQALTIYDPGIVPLSVANIALSGSDFAQTNTCGTTVAAGASCTISVTFQPTTEGAQTGTVSITDNAPGSPQQLTLTGTGTCVQLSPVSENFGSQPVGTESLPKKITLSNEGSVPVTVRSIGITGADAGDFAENNTCHSSVPAGASCFVAVTFTPMAKGKRTAAVSVSDSGGGSPQQVTLTGTGM